VTQEWIIYLVIALIFLILVLVGVVLYLGVKILNTNGALTHIKDKIKEDSSLVSADQKKSSGIKLGRVEDVTTHYCHNHPNDHAAGVCAICQNAYCEDCIKEHEGHSFCEEHFRLFLSHEWDEIDTIKTTPDIPESALPLYDFKNQLWQEQETPSVLSTHYRINIEGDFIESYVKLVVRKEELSDLKERYSKLKQ